MRRRRAAGRLDLLALGAAAMLAQAWAVPALAQQDRVLSEGKLEYEENCTACHGATGKGDGRMAEILNRKPSDLTQIAKNNGGVFPFWRVYATIEGQEAVPGHMFTPMPIWSERFKGKERKFGYEPTYLRVLVLTHYLESIQAK